MTFLYSLTNLKARIIMANSLNSNYLWRIEFMNERKLHYLLLVAFSLSNKMIIEQTNRVTKSSVWRMLSSPLGTAEDS